MRYQIIKMDGVLFPFEVWDVQEKMRLGSFLLLHQAEAFLDGVSRPTAWEETVQ